MHINSTDVGFCINTRDFCYHWTEAVRTDKQHTQPWVVHWGCSVVSSDGLPLRVGVEQKYIRKAALPELMFGRFSVTPGPETHHSSLHGWMCSPTARPNSLNDSVASDWTPWWGQRSLWFGRRPLLYAWGTWRWHHVGRNKGIWADHDNWGRMMDFWDEHFMEISIYFKCIIHGPLFTLDEWPDHVSYRELGRTGSSGSMDTEDMDTLWPENKRTKQKKQKNTFGFKLSTNLIVMDDKKV